MIKKTVYSVLIMLIILSSSALYALSDIADSWAKSYIEELVNENVLSGYPDSTFRPENNTNIGEFLKICINALTDEKVTEDSGSAWAVPYLNVMMKLGYIKPEDDDLRNLDLYITRAQIARILGRIALVKYPSMSDNIHSGAAKITDFESLDERDTYGVNFMVKLGVITGYNDGSFKGDKLCTRAELCAIISRFKSPEPVNNSLISEIKIKEGDGINTNYFTIILDYNKSIEPQLKDLENYLDDKVAIEELEDIMKYIKIKNSAEGALPMRSFSWKRGNIKVEALRGTGILTIIGD